MAAFLVLWLIGGRFGGAPDPVAEPAPEPGSQIASGDALFGLGQFPLLRENEAEDRAPARDPFTARLEGAIEPQPPPAEPSPFDLARLGPEARLGEVPTFEAPIAELRADDRAPPPRAENAPFAVTEGAPPSPSELSGDAASEPSSQTARETALAATSIAQEGAQTTREDAPRPEEPLAAQAETPAGPSSSEAQAVEIAEDERPAAVVAEAPRVEIVDEAAERAEREARSAREEVDRLAARIDDLRGERRREEPSALTGDESDERVAADPTPDAASTRARASLEPARDGGLEALLSGSISPRAAMGLLPDALDAARREARERRRYHAILASFAASAELDPTFARMLERIRVERDPEGVRIEVVDRENRSMFRSGSAAPSAEFDAMIDALARAIEQAPGLLAITGHTDARAFSGGPRDNWDLSVARANTARRALIERGILERRIARVSGRGSSEPLIAEDPFAPANRRISVVLLRE